MHSRNLLQVGLLALSPLLLAETVNLSYPKEFIWGAASSEYQISGSEGLPNSQWADFEKNFLQEKSGKAIEGFQKRIEDVALLKSMHLNGYRFSVDWSAIEPKEGVFDEKVLEEYREFCIELKKEGITPMVTLHHFSHPLWFEKKGGFEKRENLFYFVRFAKKVFSSLAHEVDLWTTINEPAVFAFMGYLLGEFPPQKKELFTALQVLRNLLDSHLLVYRELKSDKPECQIGISHNYLKFQPYHSWNPVEIIPCAFLTENFHQVVIDFFKEHRELDFFGLNYYSRAVVAFEDDTFAATAFPGEVMTDMPYAIYPEGFYEALLDLKSLHKPIYVTENGIADALDDRREMFIQHYLYALSKAIQDGVDVKGYFYWTLIDNFEWTEGWTKQFGLYSRDRKLREGSKTYKKVIELWEKR